MKGEHALCALFVVLAAGCGGSADPPTSTVDGSQTTCATMLIACDPLYSPPSYTNIFQNTFKVSCAVNGANCHSSTGRQMGLYFDTPQQAYDLLTGKTDGRARINTTKPECGILAERVESKDPDFQMPPKSGLSAEELCDLTKWLAAGAPND